MSKTLQQTHDELALRLLSIVSQMVYGRHSPTVAQMLMAVGALEDAAPNVAETHGVAFPKPAVLEEMRLKIEAHAELNAATRAAEKDKRKWARS